MGDVLSRIDAFAAAHPFVLALVWPLVTGAISAAVSKVEAGKSGVVDGLRAAGLDIPGLVRAGLGLIAGRYRLPAEAGPRAGLPLRPEAPLEQATAPTEEHEAPKTARTGS